MEQWRSAILDAQATESAKHDAGHRLRELVWEKIEPHLGGRKTVVVIPDGSLALAPWSALPGQKPGSFLLEEYAIATAAFGQQLVVLLRLERPKSAGNLLVCGGVDYDRRAGATDRPAGELASAAELGRAVRRDASVQMQFLPGTLAEVKGIAGQFKPADKGRLELLTGASADERRVAELMPSARYVHLATHGYFAAGRRPAPNQPDPLFSPVFETPGQDPFRRRATVAACNPLLLTGVMLAGANLGPVKDEHGLPTGEDGILTAEEVAGVDLLDTDLVVLSACETALGKIENEGSSACSGHSTPPGRVRPSPACGRSTTPRRRSWSNSTPTCGAKSSASSKPSARHNSPC